MAQSTPNFTAIMRQINGEELAERSAFRRAMKIESEAANAECRHQELRALLGDHMPEANPKAGHAVADGKAPLDYLEPICDAGEARVLFGGAAKYGRRNFRDPSTEMLWSTYIGSMRRHLNALHAGEDRDPDSGEHHLSHIRANTAVLMAAMDAGTLRDDRLDTTVASRSSAVHKNGNQDAKADTWSATTVEPFVVDAQCCCQTGPDYPNENCTYLDSAKWCSEMKVA